MCNFSYLQYIYILSNKQTQPFLRDHVWPLIKHDQLSHDAYHCTQFPDSYPFPTRRPTDFQHVGQVAFINDINIFSKNNTSLKIVYFLYFRFSLTIYLASAISHAVILEPFQIRLHVAAILRGYMDDHIIK